MESAVFTDYDQIIFNKCTKHELFLAQMKFFLCRARSCCLGLLPNYYQQSRLAVIVIDHSAPHLPDDVGPLSLDALVALLRSLANSASLLL